MHCKRVCYKFFPCAIFHHSTLILTWAKLTSTYDLGATVSVSSCFIRHQPSVSEGINGNNKNPPTWRTFSYNYDLDLDFITCIHVTLVAFIGIVAAFPLLGFLGCVSLLLLFFYTIVSGPGELCWWLELTEQYSPCHQSHQTAVGGDEV